MSKKQIYLTNKHKGETLSELKTFENLGDYTIELKTEAEPYGMIISLINEPDDNKIDYAKKYMGFTAYNCLAVIERFNRIFIIDGFKKRIHFIT